MFKSRYKTSVAVAGWLLFALPLACASKGPGPDSADARVKHGELALVRGRVADADRSFAEALRLEPDNRRALLGMARTRYAEGDPEGALHYFDRNAALPVGEDWTPRAHWDYCAALVMSAESALEHGHPERAAERASSLRSRDCDDERQLQLWARAQLALGARERAAGRDERALEIYRSVIEVPHDTGIEDPNGASSPVDPNLDRARGEAYRGAAELLRDAGRRREAIELLDAGLVEYPENRTLIALMVELLAAGPLAP